MSTQAPIRKGGFLAREAALLCRDDNFRLFLDRWTSHLSGVHIPDGTHQPECARAFLLDKCGIRSRAELDHDQVALTVYRQVKHEYQQWCQRQGRPVTGLTYKRGES